MTGNTGKDGVLLVRATLKLYRGAIVDAFKGAVLNWRAVLMHAGCFLLLSFLLPLLQLFGPFAGGFALGLLLALFLSIYFFTVASGVEQERVAFEEVYTRGPQLFFPLISVLFLLFILNFVADRAFAQPEMEWVRMCINLFITVLFNPLPEVIYTRGGLATEMFAVSLEFIKENFIEWFLPALICILLIALVSRATVVDLIVPLATNDPLHVVETAILNLAILRFMLLSPQNILYVVVFLYLLYFVFLFRGTLYKRLSVSTRRKRIYQERMGAIT